MLASRAFQESLSSQPFGGLMAKKFYTIMIVPHATARFRRIRVSRNLVVSGGVFLSVLMVAGLTFPHFLLKTARLSRSVEKMSQENSDLKKANERIDASLTDLRSKLADIETKAAKFALMVGVDDGQTPQLASAAGGDRSTNTMFVSGAITRAPGASAKPVARRLARR